MKRLDKLSLWLLLSFITIGPVYGQTLKKTTAQKVVGTYGGAALSTSHHSPDFGHAHDGEQCLTDALTTDWIQQAGIEAEYREQVAYQNELVRRTDRDDRTTYTIPVIFHVIYNTPSENISVDDINDLLDAVNEDFSASNPDVGEARGDYDFVAFDADIDFCLATEDEFGTPLDEYGIHRVATSETWYDPDTETNKMKGSTGGDTGTEGWDRDRYLNIWICDLTNGAMSGVAGYAYKPTIAALPPSDIDGIVIDYNLGTNPDAHILTHEIGHFLGLDHTWGGGAGSCVTDDGLDDTPNNAGPSFNYAGSCSGDQETCPGVQTQYENFMDYSNCTVMYTDDQVDLMYLVLDGSRSELTTSDVCDSPADLPPVAEFEADITTLIEGGSANFTDLSDNSPTSWNWVIAPAAGVSFIGGTIASSENPVIQFANAGLYDITLTATNAEGSDSEVKSDYIEVLVGGDGTTDCDTLRNYTETEFDNSTYYSVGADPGYYPSQLSLSGDLVRAYAETFNAPEATFLKQLNVGIVQLDDIGGASDVTFRVWNDAAGLPGTLLGSQVLALTDLTEGFFNIINFDSPVPVTGDYWVGLEYDYSAGFDTLLLLTTAFDDRPAGPSTSSMFIDGAGWLLSSDVFVGEPNISLILDALTSNGPSPVSVVSWPDDETCEGVDITMNGFGSLNTTDYYWDITDGDDFYSYDEANLTTSFDEGTWTISLFAIGSCDSDESEDFVLTVNPPMNVSTSTENENCTAEDGEIDFSVSGGDGGPYEYSINGGATFYPTDVFTDLSASTYNYVVKDEANCEETGTVTVGNTNTFNPTISPDIVIAPGGSTDLTVTSGLTWSWYAGADFVGSMATITVTPDITTTYICNVTDDEGCEAVREVTVFIDDGSGIEGIDLAQSLTIFPNPSNGEFNIKFNLIVAQDITVSVVNILGDLVIVKAHAGIKDQTVQMDMDQVAQGVYFIIIKSNDETVTKKMIVRK